MEINIEELESNIENVRTSLKILNEISENRYDLSKTNLTAFLEYEEILKETGNIITDLKNLIDKDLLVIQGTADTFENVDKDLASSIDKA